MKKNSSKKIFSKINSAPDKVADAAENFFSRIKYFLMSAGIILVAVIAIFLLIILVYVVFAILK